MIPLCENAFRKTQATEAHHSHIVVYGPTLKIALDAQKDTTKGGIPGEKGGHSIGNRGIFVDFLRRSW